MLKIQPVDAQQQTFAKRSYRLARTSMLGASWTETGYSFYFATLPVVDFTSTATAV